MVHTRIIHTCALTWRQFCPQHLHGDNVDADDPDGTLEGVGVVQDVAAEAHSTDALPFQFASVRIRTL